jgi:D-alanyl-D-alanine carboxypeptidase/D-alanyl-D-alanine-endopeptidase (penicillin-binding protein 4)
MTAPTPERRRSLPIVALTGLAVIPAIGLAGLWQYAEAKLPEPATTTTTTVAPEPAPELTTDLLSFRRHPTPLAIRAADAAETAEWAGDVERLVAQVGDGSCLLIESGDQVVAESAPDTVVIPASNEKLLIAAAALDVLGPDHRFRTELRSSAPVGGVVPGSVYLVGGGDPVLRTAGVPDPLRYPAFNTTALEDLADQLVGVGITQIDGDIVGDGSRYDDEFRVPTWSDQIPKGEGGPYDALLVNDGLLSGSYALDPSRAAARVFLDLLIARGITVNGAAANAVAPADAGLTTLALIESLPLTDVLVEMLHTSDNTTAEMLLKEIGYAALGAGTRQAGLDTVRATLERWGVPLDGVVLADGSGLSRDNRVTCSMLAALVADTPVSAQLSDLLPAAGRDGTLRETLLGTPAEGHMLAKTGTLTDVKALTGTQPGSDSASLAFSLVLNRSGADAAAVYEPLWEALADTIAAYPVVIVPDVARFGPQ